MLQYSIEFPNPIEYPIGIKIFYRVFGKKYWVLYNILLGSQIL